MRRRQRPRGGDRWESSHRVAERRVRRRAAAPARAGAPDSRYRVVSRRQTAANWPTRFASSRRQVPLRPGRASKEPGSVGSQVGEPVGTRVPSAPRRVRTARPTPPRRYCAPRRARRRRAAPVVALPKSARTPDARGSADACRDSIRRTGRRQRRRPATVPPSALDGSGTDVKLVRPCTRSQGRLPRPRARRVALGSASCSGQPS
jgi:hypothetical protein